MEYSLEGAAARPPSSSLLLQNRRERTCTSVGSDAFGLLSRSGRRPFIFPAVAPDLAKEKKEKKEDTTPMENERLESSEPPQCRADDVQLPEDMEAQKHRYECSSPPVGRHSESADMSEYAAFMWRCSIDECAYQTHGDDAGLSTLLDPPHPSFLDPLDPQVPGELRRNISSQSVSASNSSKNQVPESGNDQPTKPARSKSAARSSVNSTPSSIISTNPSKKSVKSMSTNSATSHRPSTPNRLPATTRPSTPDRPSGGNQRPSTPDRPSGGNQRPSTPDRPSGGNQRPSTPDRPSGGNQRPSTPDRPSGGNQRPSTPNRCTGPARPSTPNRTSAPNRPSTPNRSSAHTRPSTPNRTSAPTRPSTPNRSAVPTRPSTPNRSAAPTRPSTPNRSAVAMRPSTPNKSAAPTRPSTPSKPSTPARSSTPNRTSAPSRPSTPNKPSAAFRSPTPTKAPTSGKAGRPSTPNGRASSISNSSEQVESAVGRASSISNSSEQVESAVLPTTMRPSTPGKPRPLTASGDNQSQHRPHLSRPSTPSRPRAPETGSTPVSNQKSTSNTSRSNCRTSTPSRRMPEPPSSLIASRATSTGRRSSIKNSGAMTWTNSPGSRSNVSTKPTIPTNSLPDETPSLRTTLPERPASIGKARPGAKLSDQIGPSSEPSPPTKPTTRRKSPSPVTSRGRFRDNSPVTRNRADMQKTAAMDGTTKKPSKTATATENNGLGHTLTKRSLDMALKKMNNCKGAGGIRGVSLFPHSIRTTTLLSSPSLSSSGLLTPTSSNETDMDDASWNDTTSGSISIHDGVSENSEPVMSPHGQVLGARIKEPDLKESYGHGAVLLKEESKDLDWLHNSDSSMDLLKENPKDIEWLHSTANIVDDRPIFENQFRQFPKPFDLT